VAYVAIADFKYGMDRRRPRIAGVAGTLYTLKNAHISRGGDIERAKRFVLKYSLPGGTHGLARVRDQLYVFGSADLAAAMPLGVLYQRLIAPDGVGLVRVLDVRTFSGKLYVVAQYDDGQICHFYNGVRVTDWDAIGISNSNVTTLAEYMATRLNSSPVVKASSSGNTVTTEARVPGVPVIIATSTINGGGGVADQTLTNTVIQANVAPVAEVRSHGNVTITGGTFVPEANAITQLTVDGTPLLTQPVHWRTSDNATATALAVAIGNNTSTHGYTAFATLDVVTIQAAVGLGMIANGRVVVATLTGDVTVSTFNFTGGVNKVNAVAQINKFTFGGTYEAADIYQITINGLIYNVRGAASGVGTSAFTYKQREWSVAGTLFVGSKLNDPSNWSDTAAATGFVQIDASNESEGSERLVCVGQYSNYAVVFGRSQIRLYTISTDAQEISFYQSLDNTGTFANRSVLSFGNNDVFYLDPSGIRSIRARDVLNAAYVNDVGTAIDPFVHAHLRELAIDTITRAVSAVEPVDGRYWLAIDNRIYVLSYFPSSKVTAWSYYELPYRIEDFVRDNARLYVRGNNDKIYLYGGDSGEEYPEADEQPVSVELPFLSADSPATQKMISGADVALVNEWMMKILPDPNNESVIQTIGRLTRNSFHEPHIPVTARTSHFALTLECTKAGFASLSGILIHFQGGEEDR
jgi:hypothetical protein